jgi:hypothetical protein
MVDRCCICKRNGESVDHLLLHCDVVYALWSVLFTHFGMSWVMLRRVIDLVACWWTSGRSECCNLEDGADLPFLVWLLYPLCRFVLAIFLFVFCFLVKCLLLYTFGVLRSALCF